jgi:hypothetical protein
MSASESRDEKHATVFICSKREGKTNALVLFVVRDKRKIEKLGVKPCEYYLPNKF